MCAAGDFQLGPMTVSPHTLPFFPYLEPSGKRVPKRVLYMFKNLKRFRIITKNGTAKKWF